MASAITTRSSFASAVTADASSFLLVLPFNTRLLLYSRLPVHSVTDAAVSPTKSAHFCKLCTAMAMAMAAAGPASRLAIEALPPTMPSACEQPPLYDGETRLYMSYICPYAQRAWITRNYKGLQEKIKLVPIDMNDRPAWYKEVYPKNTVPSLEHNNKIMGESLDLIKYIDSNFEGPKLTSDDSEKQKLAEELLAYSDIFNQAVRSALISKDAMTAEAAAALDNIELYLSKFDNGAFFLGQFSLVDIAYAPFIDGLQTLFAGIKNYDITEGRANIQIFIKEMNKIDAYTHTKQDPSEVIALTKKKLGI